MLGPLAVRAGDDEVSIGGTKRRALLTLLLVKANRVVPAERLIEDLWEGNPPDSAAGTLQSHISHLRRALGADHLLTRGGGYVLQLAEDELDAAVFEAELAEGRAALAGGDPALAADVLSRAVARWRGPAFDDAAGAAWAVAEAARLEEARLVATESLLEARLRLGGHSEVVGQAEAAVAEHPLRERLWALLMLALYREGRQAEALRAYQRVRSHLGEELGIEPSAELRALEQQILAQDPSLAAPIPAATPAPAASSRPLPSGVVTFLLTDVVGSTRLWETASDVMPDALRRHDDLVRAAVDAHDGVLLKARGEGDSTFSVFRRASDAAAAALDAQAALGQVAWPESCAIAVRMAIHTGESVEHEGDYYGRTVNRVARLRSIAEGGQVLVSHATADVIIDNLPADARLVELGPTELRDLDRPETVYLLTDASAHAAAVAQEFAAAFEHPPLPSRLVVSPGIDFVGRETERDLLKSRLKEVEEGGRRVVLLAGEPGIGKTALAADFATAAHAGGATVLYGRCDEDLGVPYQPWVEAITHLLDHPSGAVRGWLTTRAAGDLARLVPSAGEPSAPAGDPETERWLAFGGVASVLDAASTDAPIMLVLDDLHWADKGTLLLLRHVVEGAEAGRLLVLATYRHSDLAADHPLADTLATLRRDANVERIALEGLGDLDLLTLFESAAGYELDERGIQLAHAVRRETAGNPFFVGEIVRHLVESGTVFVEGGRWEARTEIGEISLPDSVREVVGRRVARLGADVEQVLTVGAVIGRDFELGLLAAALGRSEDDVLEVLERAEAASLVRTLGPEEFTFAHTLIAHTLESGLTATRRARAHRTVAEAIEALPDAETRVAELARHWSAATTPADVAKAVDYAKEAGRQALRALSPDEAVRWYTQALDLLSQQPAADEHVRCELLVRLGGAQRQAGSDFRTTLLDAAALAERIGDTEQLVRAALSNNRGMWSVAGKVDEQRIAVLESAIAALDDEDSAARARLLVTLAAELAWTPEQDRRRVLADEATAMARGLGEPLTLAQVLLLRFSAIWIPEMLEERTANVVEAEALIEAHSGGRILSAWAAAFRYMAAVEALNRPEMDRALARFLQLADETGMPFHQWTAAIYQLGHSLVTGDLDRAETHNAALVALEGAVSGTEDIVSANEALLAWYRGRFGEGIAAARIVAQSQIYEEPEYWEARLALACLYANERDEGERLLAKALPNYLDNRRGTGSWLGAIGIWAMVVAKVGHMEFARSLYDTLLPFADQAGTNGPLVWTTIAHVLGELATLLERYDDAEAHFAHAEQIAEHLQAPFHLARAHLDWGRMLLKRRAEGDVERAVDLLGRARDLAGRYGCAGVEREAIALLASPAAQPDPPPLPSRLGAIAAGSFVGRQHELEQIQSALATATTGDRRLVLIAGEPGIGKSALAARIAQEARASRGSVLYGRCDEDVRVPYQPFVDALERLIELAPDSMLDSVGTRKLAELTRLIPSLHDRRSDLPEPQPSDPETERYLLMNAVVAAVTAAAAESPVVIVLDDVHWADQSTLLLLRHLIANSANLRLLVVATYRDSEVDDALGKLLSALRREAGVERVVLAGLAEGELSELTGADADVVRAVYRESDGNPFFATELVRHLAESGNDDLPSSIREVVVQRVARLGDDSAAALAVAAVIGQEFELDLLAAASSQSPDDLLAIVERAEAASVVRTAAPGRFLFSHALVQHALYSEFSATRRARAHRAVAEAIEGLGLADARVPELAWHWSAAGDTERAIEYAVRAGEEAVAGRAPAEAAVSYAQALALLAQNAAPDETLQCELLCRLAESQCWSGDPSFRATVIEAAAVARRLNDAPRLARAALTDYEQGASAYDAEQVDILEAALTAVGDEDSPVRAQLLGELARRLMFVDGPRSIALVEEALTIARRIGPAPGLHPQGAGSLSFDIALFRRTWAVQENPMFNLGRSADRVLISALISAASTLTVADTRLASAQEAYSHAQELGDPAGECVTAMRVYDTAVLFGKLVERRTVLLRARQLADEIGRPDLLWHVRMREASEALLNGDAAEGERLAEEAWAVGRETGQLGALGVYAGHIVTARWYQDRPQEAAPIVAEAAASDANLAILHLPVGPTGGDEGVDLASAIENLKNDGAWLPSLTVLADAAARQRDTRAATVAYDLLLPFGFLTNVVGGPLLRGSVAHYLGALATVLGNYEQAEEHFRAAVAFNEEQKAPFFLARAQLAFARMLLERREDGDLDRGVELLQQAIAIAQEHGYPGIERRATALLESPAARPGPPPLPPRLEAATQSPFVGRDAERAAFTNAFNAAAQGERRVVLLSGEPGIGKTRMATTVAVAARDAGALVIYGRCDEDVRAPYGAFAQALEQLVDASPNAQLEAFGDRRLAELARLVPTLTDRRPGLPEPQPTDPETARYVLMNAAVDTVFAASADRSIVLILDDLHWADEPTLVLLRHLVASGARGQLLILATYRSSEVADNDPLTATLAALHRESRVETIALAGLGEPEIVEWIEALSGQDMDARGIALAQALHAETDGNPFFAGELMRHLSETGAFERQGGRWVASASLEETGLPESIRTVVTQRVARVGEAAERALTMAAVAGADFDLGVLAAAVDVPEDELLETLEQAEGAGLVSSTGPETFGFAHGLVRQTLYENLTPTRRARSHRAVAEAIEQLGLADARTAELARHWAEASTRPADLHRAIELARLAGNEAVRALAPGEAVRWYTRSLELLDRKPSADPHTRCELLVRLGRAQRHATDPAFRQTLLDAAHLAQEIGDTEQLVRAALQNNQGFAMSPASSDLERIAVIEAALAAVGNNALDARARLLATLAAEGSRTFDLGHRQALSDEALAIARRLGEKRTLLQVLSLRYNAIWVPGTLEERLGNSAEAVALADEVGEPVGRYWAAAWRFWALGELGDVDGARRCVDVMTAVAAEVRQPLQLCIEKLYRCYVAVFDARLADAERLDEECRELATTLGMEDELRGNILAGIRWTQGRLMDIVPEIDARVERLGPEAFFAPFHALAHCEQGRFDEARALIDAALTKPELQLDRAGLAPLLVCAEVCVTVGTDAQAEQLLELVEPFHESFCCSEGIHIGFAYSVALLAARLGLYDKAEAYFAEAEAQNAPLTLRFGLASTHLAWGRMLLERRRPGDVERGVELLEQALACAREEGYGGVEREAAALLASV